MSEMDRLVDRVGGNGVWELRMICIECGVFDRLNAWAVAHGMTFRCEVLDKMARIFIDGVFTAPTQGASDENAKELASYDMIGLIVTAEAAAFCRRVVLARRAYVSLPVVGGQEAGVSYRAQTVTTMSTANAKTDLAAACEAREMPSPVYLHEKTGPQHAPSFRARVTIGGRSLGWFEGVFSRQREAENDAAMRGLMMLMSLTTTTAPF